MWNFRHFGTSGIAFDPCHHPLHSLLPSIVLPSYIFSHQSRQEIGGLRNLFRCLKKKVDCRGCTPTAGVIFSQNLNYVVTTDAMRPVAVLNPGAVTGTLAGSILSFVAYLDSEWSSSEWEPRKVAIVTALVLGVIRIGCGDAYGVSWYSFSHGVVSGYLSAMAVWLSIFAAVPLTGMSEPLRSITCQGPLTSMHRFVPAITMGYGLFDIFDGFSHGIDFVRVHREILGRFRCDAMYALTPHLLACFS